MIPILKNVSSHLLKSFRILQMVKHLLFVNFNLTSKNQALHTIQSLKCKEMSHNVTKVLQGTCTMKKVLRN